MPLFASQRSTSCSAVILKNNNVARAPMAKAVELPFFSTAEALYERATETERELFIGGYCTCTYCVQKCEFSIDFVSEQYCKPMHVVDYNFYVVAKFY